MTAINPINDITPSVGGSPARPVKPGETDSFGHTFSKALEKARTTGATAAPAQALMEITSKELNLTRPSDIVSGKTDKLLAMLDSYSSKLEDPTVSLKSIAPVLEEINNKADSLLKDSRFLTDQDAALKKIATQTIITAQTEYLKFQRGDYIS